MASFVLAIRESAENRAQAGALWLSERQRRRVLSARADRRTDGPTEECSAGRGAHALLTVRKLGRGRSLKGRARYTWRTGCAPVLERPGSSVRTGLSGRWALAVLGRLGRARKTLPLGTVDLEGEPEAGPPRGLSGQCGLCRPRAPLAPRPTHVGSSEHHFIWKKINAEDKF